MALNIVSGGMGTGKSYFAVRKGEEALRKGRILVTNFPLEEDWAEQIAFRVPFHTLKHPTRRRRRRAAQLLLNHIHTPELSDLLRVRIRQEAPYGEWVTKKSGEVVWRPKEGSAIIILDEAHDWMNAREWKDSERKEILGWLTRTRKMGAEVYVISQHADNVDTQVRRLCEDHIRLNALHRSARFLGLRIIPFKCFLACTYSMHYPKEISRRDHYLLNWTRLLYDTMETVSFSQNFEPAGGAIWLPHRPAGEQDAAPAGSAERSECAPPAAAPDPRLDGEEEAAAVAAAELHEEAGDPARAF